MPHSLRPYNTFGIEADCKELICYHSIDECLTAARHLQSSGLPWLPIGEGSNILFVNPHYPGTVVHNSITGIYPEEEGLEITLRVGGGEISGYNAMAGLLCRNGFVRAGTHVAKDRFCHRENEAV